MIERVKTLLAAAAVLIATIALVVALNRPSPAPASEPTFGPYPTASPFDCEESVVCTTPEELEEQQEQLEP